MNPSKMLQALGVALGVSMISLIGAAVAKDLWIHPRNEPFNPGVHYRASDGEVFYKEENDLGRAIGDITLSRGDRPLVTMTIGPDILRKVAESNGSLSPVLLWDSDGDGRVDRSAVGSVDGTTATFDSPLLADVNLQLTRWQLGVRYVAGTDGRRELDGRYLASVNSENANIAFIRDDALPEVAEAEPVVAPPEAPLQPGLVILKHRAGQPFDLAAFVDDSSRFIEDFDRLSRQPGDDDWTANSTDGKNGTLLTHFADEDLFIVRTEGGATLEVEWGDLPMVAFFEFYLEVDPDEKGCYSSLRSKLTNDDGTPVTVPHRFFYCPDDSVALFDVPDGYQVGLTATFENRFIERTDAGNSTMDNVRLYAKEVYPRSPLARATGSVNGNIRAGLFDAREDLKDVFRHAVTGTRPTNVHTGQRAYRASPITAVPRALFSLVKLDPFGALDELATGLDSTVQVGASAVSAIDNAVLNPVVQSTLGNLASPEAADKTTHVIGAVTGAAAQNLPGGGRSFDAFSVGGVLNHNRAYEPWTYTRTDTQLNIDRVMTVVDTAVISNNSDDSDGDDGGDQGNGDNGGNQGNPPGNGGNGDQPPMMQPPGGGGGGGAPPMMQPPDGGQMKKMRNRVLKKRILKKRAFKKKVFKKKVFKKKVAKKKIAKKKFFKKKIAKKKPFQKKIVKKKVFKPKRISRSGLGDGTNPGQGAGRIKSPNKGILNPNKARLSKKVSISKKFSRVSRRARYGAH